jgi:cysteine-rich repeat protein
MMTSFRAPSLMTFRAASLAAALAALACGGEPCGNGVLDADEECDDGLGNSDGADCTSECQVAECGDGFTLAGVEQCDDGAANADDASCTATCEFARCGDSLVLSSSEDCDEGTANADDGPCTSRCKDATCGDGLTWDGVEECDNGADNDDAGGCTLSCSVAFCGDGLVRDGTESCDEGAANADDAGCTSACEMATCGDLLVWAGVEECDDGNTLDGDSCTSQCLLPTTLSLADADAKLIGEAAGDNAGYEVASAGDVNADGNDDLLITASLNDGGGADSGAAYVVLGPVLGPIDLSTAYAKWEGEGAASYLSYGRGAGDVNGDGRDDLLLGSLDDEGGMLAGAAYLALGTVGGTSDLANAWAKRIGESAQDFAGSALAAVGDVDGNGEPDFLIGASGRDEGGGGAGVAYLLLGPVSGDQSLGTSAAKLLGESGGDAAGYAVARAGDIDGDGLDDLLVGSPQHAEAGIATGAAYLALGTVRGTTNLSAAEAKLLGDAASDNAGLVLGGGADFDGDGSADVLVGSPLNDDGGTDAGAAYVVLGTTHGTVQLADSHAKLLGAESQGQAGGSVDVAGDVDGDGAEDMLVGAHLITVSADDEGAAYLLFGPISAGTIDLASAPMTLLGESTDDLAGWSAAAAGDLDNDGLDDVIVSAIQDDDGGVNAGAAYVILGASL